MVAAEVAVVERLRRLLLGPGEALPGSTEAAADGFERFGRRDEADAGVALIKILADGVCSFLILSRFEARSSFGEPQKVEGAL